MTLLPFASFRLSISPQAGGAQVPLHGVGGTGCWYWSLSHPPLQQASVLCPGCPGSRLHHLPPWPGPLHGFSGKRL